MTTYFVEERSGAIGIGPIANRSPELYFRRTKTNWGSITAWIHLIICLISIPLIIWNLLLLVSTIVDYTEPRMNVLTNEPYGPVHPFALLVILCAICMNLLAGVFALTTEAACFSEKLAKFLYILAYLSITISIFALVLANNLLGLLWIILLGIFMVLFGIGFWRFTIISAIYLNEEGPVWFKPLLYFCLAAIPLLSTSSQCPEVKPNVKVYGCLSSELFKGRTMYNDFYSFTLMIIIAILSAIPFLFGMQHIE